MEKVLLLALTLLLIAPANADYAGGMEHFRKAFAAYQARDLEGALKLVKSAIAEDPQNAQAFALEGDIYYNLQDLDRAGRAWKRALGLNPQLDVVREKMKRLAMEKGVEENLGASSESIFEIRMEKDGEGKIGTVPQVGVVPRWGLSHFSHDEIMAHLKSAYETIGNDFDYYPKHKIIVLLYSPEDFAKIRAVPEWVAGLYDGKIRIPIRMDEDKEGLKRIIWHEYTHALVFDIAKGKCPVFLNEGLAEHESEKSQINPKSKIQKLYPLVTYFLPENLNKKPLTLDAGRFYASSRSLVEYIVFIWGWDGMRNLLRAIGSGKEWPECVRDVLRIEPLELEKRWMSWAEDKEW